jgi:RNA polymerase sigma-70 factor (ECF subfamily)
MSSTPPHDLDFDAIVRDTQAHIRAYIAGLGVPRHDVDDIAQDVYVELYRFADRIPVEIPPKQWLKGIARNLCMNYFRRSSRRQRLQREALVEIFLRAQRKESPTLSEGPVRRALDGCCEKLSSESQRLLALRYEQELASHQIAERIQSTPEAVRIALFRIRTALKACIGKSLAADAADERR